MVTVPQDAVNHDPASRSEQSVQNQPSKRSSAPVVLTITGMSCAGCVSSVSRVLARVPGVTDAHVDLASGRATISGTARAEDLIRAVEAVGYGGRLS